MDRPRHPNAIQTWVPRPKAPAPEQARFTPPSRLVSLGTTTGRRRTPDNTYLQTGSVEHP